MPELPEVETICRQLRQVILGAEISGIHVLDPKLRGIGGFEGRKVLGVYRHGKALEMELEGGLTLLFHFRMTGRFLWQDGDGLPPHARLLLSSSRGRIVLIDPRRFATIMVRDGGIPPSVGSDPLEDLNPSHLWEISQRSHLPVKSFLIDQRHIAGIGNIYACEILHQAHINPWRSTDTLSCEEWKMMGGAAATILTEAIACRGTTISDWHDLFGEEGTYQDHLLVYGRGGERCFGCGGEIQRQKLNGRGTYFCPSCQT